MESNKTLLANPIFVNPKAYEVFPRIAGYLTQDNESTKEPARFNGTIEVVSIKKNKPTQSFVNTDEVDLSSFTEDTIRINLITSKDSCVLGEWKIGNINPEDGSLFNIVIDSNNSIVPVVELEYNNKKSTPESVLNGEAIGIYFLSEPEDRQVFIGDDISSDSDINCYIVKTADIDPIVSIGDTELILNAYGSYLEQAKLYWVGYFDEKYNKVTSYNFIDTREIKFTTND